MRELIAEKKFWKRLHNGDVINSGQKMKNRSCCKNIYPVK